MEGDQENNTTNYGGYGETTNEGYGDASGGEEWTQYEDDDGNPYYYNNYTGESTYDYPY